MLFRVNAQGLQSKRQLANISPYKLAKDLNLSINSIYRLENGSTKSVNHLRAEAIACALGCKVKDICEIPADKKVD